MSGDQQLLSQRMTIYRDKRLGAWRFDFWYLGCRHISPRGFPTKGEATEAETTLRRRLRRAAAGLDAEEAERPSIRIVEWAGVYLHHVQNRKRHRDVESIRSQLRGVLLFWGARPKNPEDDREQDAPYHDYTLTDPIDDPALMLKFEDWMLARGISASTRNHFRTRMSQLYALAISAQHRKLTGITLNPFRSTGLREPTHGRTVTLSLEDLRKILGHARAPLRLAIGIAALAPKLRLSNVCALRWTREPDGSAYVSPDFRQLIIHDHKTMERSGPLITPTSAQLRHILQAASQARPRSTFVIGVAWDRFRVKDVLREACEAAGVVYGLKQNGVTFHTIRHTAATLLAAQGVPEGLRKQVMGHLAIATTQKYTHLEPTHEIGPLEQLSAALPIADLVMPSARARTSSRVESRTSRGFRLVPKSKKDQ